MPDIDLNKLAYEIAQNDHYAFKQLYDHYSNTFFRLANAIVKSAEMAEEIVQDVFIQVWKKRKRIAEVENLHFYLYVSTRNISRSYLRKYQHKKFINFDDVQLPYFTVDITPEDSMISGEIVNRINVAINNLPPQCKLIFKLVKEDGLKYREVAELLHLSVKTVENQMAIAFRKMHIAVKIALPLSRFSSPGD